MNFEKAFSHLATTTEVAARIGCHPRTVARAADNGSLVSVRWRDIRLIDVPASHPALRELARRFAKGGRARSK